MKKDIFKINNTNILTLDGSACEIKVLHGHGYLFLVKKLGDGRTGARHEIANFGEGESFPNISGNEKYDIILAGTNGTEVEFSEPTDPNFDKSYEPTKAGVQKLAKDNTIRVREVVLREKWYKEDNGHLIGFYKKDGEIDISNENDTSDNLIPVALIKNKNNSDLEAAVMDRLLKLPVDFFKGFSSGDLAARTMTISEIRKAIFNIVLSVFMNFIFSFVYLIQCFRFSGYFAKWSILFCIFPILISAVFCWLTYKWEKMLIDCQGKIQGMLLQFLNGIEKITNSHSEKRFFTQWSNEYIRQTKVSYTLGLVGIVSSLINAVYPTVVSVIFYYLYGRGLKMQAITGLTTGTFMAFLSSYSSFQEAFLGVAGALLQIRNVIPLSKRIQPILDAKPEFEASKPPIDKLRGNIEISHLNFRYFPDSPLVLKDVNMSIKEGEFVAVVGTSGAGKSTLMRMLLGFEKPE
ncbi:MAG: ATP-binding cassette domain-containing protein [Treponema sp.]|uniref:ATP-binding cassette domain-containing protein n=1 Tax=Treponema sp. TaxID=166 RepID=UPI0025E4A049|nr:ATP-binding cassette domain-containing protein [Treponema sp.]MBR0496756.1 ATP-binding cassette domain-containing protein [Treponema sp.]